MPTKFILITGYENFKKLIDRHELNIQVKIFFFSVVDKHFFM